ncbi:uncharacterized protein [Nicotiana sylvestris]|uniref:uncharacterized protein n=1 Tax=Nicotiana sylvestris TaxID=4096 RepID=UPI00388C8F33
MLRACVINFGGQWDQFLPLVEFAYNNGYQSNIEMAPFEALYGRRCRSPIRWFEPGEAKLYGTDLVKDALYKVKLIQERLRTAQSIQKSYADQKVRDVAFMVGEKVLLKVLPMKGIMRFGKKFRWARATSDLNLKLPLFSRQDPAVFGLNLEN